LQPPHEEVLMVNSAKNRMFNPKKLKRMVVTVKQWLQMLQKVTISE